MNDQDRRAGAPPLTDRVWDTFFERLGAETARTDCNYTPPVPRACPSCFAPAFGLEVFSLPHLEWTLPHAECKESGTSFLDTPFAFRSGEAGPAQATAAAAPPPSTTRPATPPGHPSLLLFGLRLGLRSPLELRFAAFFRLALGLRSELQRLALGLLFTAAFLRLALGLRLEAFFFLALGLRSLLALDFAASFRLPLGLRPPLELDFAAFFRLPLGLRRLPPTLFGLRLRLALGLLAELGLNFSAFLRLPPGLRRALRLRLGSLRFAFFPLLLGLRSELQRLALGLHFTAAFLRLALGLRLASFFCLALGLRLAAFFRLPLGLRSLLGLRFAAILLLAPGLREALALRTALGLRSVALPPLAASGLCARAAAPLRSAAPPPWGVRTFIFASARPLAELLPARRDVPRNVRGPPPENEPPRKNSAAPGPGARRACAGRPCGRLRSARPP